MSELTILRMLTLGAADAVNPCALAVLSMMLISIISYNPKKRRNILLAGFAFTISVFVMYLVYGLVLIKFFTFIQSLVQIKLLLYKVFGGLAIILGLLEIYDFVSYSPGTVGTEMPLSLRPKAKKLISKITSPKAAFGVGVFVTIFLLPCTIGPYIAAAGSLSTAVEFLQALPYLLLYNVVFVLPMIGITLIVYAGITSVENVSEWKDQNIVRLHLIAGIILLAVGIGMIMGLI
ncbi:MAG: cytochrome c biogenesis CcdA family protein [Candidatus Aenigmatarchaeota archaeon]